MTNDLIIEAAIDELLVKRLGSTEQLLEIHDVVYYNGKPKVLRVDRERNDGNAIVYFPVKDEKFYLAVFVYTTPEIGVSGIYTEACHAVYLKINSKIHSYNELAAMTRLEPTGGWNKGDARKNSSFLYSWSALFVEPNSEPDDFEDKMNKLLDHLETDKHGVAALVNSTDAWIQVASKFHNGNTMIGGYFLTKSMLKRITDLGLEVDFDIYAEGNFYK